MKVVKNNPEIIDLNAGDAISIWGYNDAAIWSIIRVVKIRRIVEARHGTYVVFDDDTWRPISTYGETWEKCPKMLTSFGDSAT